MMLNFSELQLGELPKPTQMMLADGSVLTINAVVRVLPNARVVVRGNLNQEAVYAKIYIGHRASIHAAREAEGTKHLNTANILTPKLLLETTSQNQPVIVYAAIENALNAEDFMRQSDYLGRREMALNLVQAVAQHHTANLMQTDIHLKNFIVAGAKTKAESIYTIDGDGIVKTSSKSQKQRNLATFLSKFDALDDDFMQESVEAYCVARNEKFELNQFVKTYLLTQKIRQKTASDYADKKVFRTCTDVKVIDDRPNLLHISRQFNVENQLLDDMNVYLNVPSKNIKNGNTCTIGVAQIGDKQIVIKRYNIKSFWHGIKLGLRQSRAKKSWANAHRLQIYNIATPQPLALVLECDYGLNNRDYFLSEFIDAPDIAEFFASTESEELKKSVAFETARLFYKLSLLKIVHGDCKATNIKIKDGKPVLLDLDAMFVSKSLFLYEKQHVRDLKRFMQNWQNDTETTALLNNAFKLGYSGDDEFSVPSALIQAGIA